MSFSLSEHVSKFLSESSQFKKIDKHILHLCRVDGILVFSTDKSKSIEDQASVGALIGGVWQAAETRSSFIPGFCEKDVYRFSFDTSSRGIYIYPIAVGTVKYYLSLTFADEINPGLVKSTLRTLAEELTLYLIKNSNIENISEDGFLFKDITDEEMDNIFSTAGH